LQITEKNSFTETLDNILKYIAEDSLNRAFDFNDQLEEKIDNIPYMPYKYRKSIYHNNENIRDMIFKGYTISYLIDKENNRIILLDIIKWINK
jgi:mRNA-degrading endonuclease RelE of RelBE toxin-antitoxin system